MLAKSFFKADLPRGGTIEGAAQTALKPNSLLIKCIVKCGVNEVAGNLPSHVVF